MFKTIKNVKVNYKQYGLGKDIVLLHGWGQNIQMMEPLGNYLKENHRITIVDLPGFGLSAEPNIVWTLNDYVDMLNELFLLLNIKKPILIGHSFGGRLSIIYASKYDANKVILLASPCVRHNFENKKIKVYKKIKKIPILKSLLNKVKKYFGSSDYKNATPMMRDILVKVINEDLSDYAKNIKVPCLLIWGDNDTAVTTSEARELDNLLNDSKLIILKGTHYCYLENIHEVVNLIKNFI